MMRTHLYALMMVSVVAGRAHAGPKEVFYGASLGADSIVANYVYGGGGLFLSTDGGKDFGLLCGIAIDPLINEPKWALLSAGSLFVPGFNGVWRGDSKGCGFSPIPEFKTHYIAAASADPLDATRTYFASSDPIPKPNFLFILDGDGLRQLGAQTQSFIETLYVLKVGDRRRFYESALLATADTDETVFSVRVSDDDAETWVEHVVKLETNESFVIVAVNPFDPDQLVARVSRRGGRDKVLYSADQGRPDSWRELAELSTFAAAAFTPDGKLYFGDKSSRTPGLYVVDKPGEAPRQLADSWMVGCLSYDATSQRMLACSEWFMGQVDLDTGALETTFDMHCARQFVECPGEQPMATRCQGQILPEAFCGPTHYPVAPLCTAYPQSPELLDIIAAQGFTCVEGRRMDKPEPAAGSGGAGGSAGGMAGAAAPVAPVQPNDGGCACTLANGRSNRGLAGWLALLAICWPRLRRR